MQVKSGKITDVVRVSSIEEMNITGKWTPARTAGMDCKIFGEIDSRNTQKWSLKYFIQKPRFAELPSRTDSSIIHPVKVTENPKKWNVKHFVKNSKMKQSELRVPHPKKGSRNETRKWDLKNFVLKSDLKGFETKTEAPHLPKRPSTVKKRRKSDSRNLNKRSSLRRPNEMSGGPKIFESLSSTPVVKLKTRDRISKQQLFQYTGMTYGKWNEYYHRSKNPELPSDGKAFFSLAKSPASVLDKDFSEEDKEVDHAKSLLYVPKTHQGEIFTRKRKLIVGMTDNVNTPPLQKIRRKGTLRLIVKLFGEDSETEELTEQLPNRSPRVSCQSCSSAVTVIIDDGRVIDKQIQDHSSQGIVDKPEAPAKSSPNQIFSQKFNEEKKDRSCHSCESVGNPNAQEVDVETSISNDAPSYLRDSSEDPDQMDQRNEEIAVSDFAKRKETTHYNSSADKNNNALGTTVLLTPWSARGYATNPSHLHCTCASGCIPSCRPRSKKYGSTSPSYPLGESDFEALETDFSRNPLNKSKAQEDDVNFVQNLVATPVSKGLLADVEDGFIVKFHNEYLSWTKADKDRNSHDEFMKNLKYMTKVLLNSKSALLSALETEKVMSQIPFHSSICKHLSRVFTSLTSRETYPLFALMYILRSYQKVFSAEFKVGLLQPERLNVLKVCVLTSLRKSTFYDNTTDSLKSILSNPSFDESGARIWRVLQVFHSVHDQGQGQGQNIGGEQPCDEGSFPMTTLLENDISSQNNPPTGSGSTSLNTNSNVIRVPENLIVSVGPVEGFQTDSYASTSPPDFKDTQKRLESRGILVEQLSNDRYGAASVPSCGGKENVRKKMNSPCHRVASSGAAGNLSGRSGDASTKSPRKSEANNGSTTPASNSFQNLTPHHPAFRQPPPYPHPLPGSVDANPRTTHRVDPGNFPRQASHLDTIGFESPRGAFLPRSSFIQPANGSSRGEDHNFIQPMASDCVTQPSNFHAEINLNSSSTASTLRELLSQPSPVGNVQPSHMIHNSQQREPRGATHQFISGLTNNSCAIPMPAVQSTVQQTTIVQTHSQALDYQQLLRLRQQQVQYQEACRLQMQFQQVRQSQMQHEQLQLSQLNNSFPNALKAHSSSQAQWRYQGQQQPVPQVVNNRDESSLAQSWNPSSTYDTMPLNLVKSTSRNQSVRRRVPDTRSNSFDDVQITNSDVYRLGTVRRTARTASNDFEQQQAQERRFHGCSPGGQTGIRNGLCDLPANHNLAPSKVGRRTASRGKVQQNPTSSGLTRQSVPAHMPSYGMDSLHLPPTPVLLQQAPTTISSSGGRELPSSADSHLQSVVPRETHSSSLGMTQPHLGQSQFPSLSKRLAENQTSASTLERNSVLVNGSPSIDSSQTQRSANLRAQIPVSVFDARPFSARKPFQNTSSTIIVRNTNMPPSNSGRTHNMEFLQAARPTVLFAGKHTSTSSSSPISAPVRNRPLSPAAQVPVSFRAPTSISSFGKRESQTREHSQIEPRTLVLQPTHSSPYDEHLTHTAQPTQVVSSSSRSQDRQNSNSSFGSNSYLIDNQGSSGYVETRSPASRRDPYDRSIIDETHLSTDNNGRPFLFHIRSAETGSSSIDRISTATSSHWSGAIPNTEHVTNHEPATSFERTRVNSRLVMSPTGTRDLTTVTPVPAGNCRKARVKYTKCRPASEIRRNPSLGKFIKKQVRELAPIDTSTNSQPSGTSEESDNDLQIDESSPTATTGTSSNTSSPIKTRETPHDPKSSVLEMLEQISDNNFNKDYVLDLLRKQCGSNESSESRSNCLVAALETTAHQERREDVHHPDLELPGDVRVPDEPASSSDQSDEIHEPRISSGELVPSSGLADFPQLQVEPGEPVVGCGKIPEDCKKSVAKHKLPASIEKPPTVFRKRESKNKTDKISSNTEYQVILDAENQFKLYLAPKNSSPKSSSNTVKCASASSASTASDTHDSLIALFDMKPTEEIKNVLIKLYLDRRDCTESDKSLARESLLKKTVDWCKELPKEQICALLALNLKESSGSNLNRKKRRRSPKEKDPVKMARLPDKVSRKQLNTSRRASGSASQLTPPPTPIVECSFSTCKKEIIGANVSCEGCDKVFYCSETCRDEDYMKGHWDECARDNVF